MKCESPLDRDTLLAYRLGELDADSEARVEEHYLGCAACSRRLEELAALAGEARAVTRMSGVNFVASDAFVRRLSKSGLQVREYSVPWNGSVNCTVAPGDDFVVARLEAPLAEVQRVDMVYLDSDGKPEMRQEDVPFVAASGGVLLSTRIDTVRALPKTTLRVRLLAVDDGAERTLGEYRFNHTPYSAQRPE
ncbi:MAG: zf-HC2 domain-containing protein [Thiogranum sp.]|nr:zf-HC2 domain-containing protein [Thiogranum sp.]